MSADVVIVGAGIMGSAIARELTRAGRSVHLLEKSIPGAEASSVAAGILAPQIEHDAGPLRELGMQSREAYARLAGALKDETGIDIGFVRCGVLSVALDEAGAASLAGSRIAGVEQITGRQARALEPALSDGVCAAVLLPDEAQVDPPRVLSALVRSAEKLGARVTSGAAVRRLVREGDRVVGVETDRGIVHAEHVVLAAGAWTSLVPGLPRALAAAVRPVRGQLVRAELRAPIARRIVFAEHAYIVSRPDGRVVCGATMEEVGFAKEVTLGAVGALASQAVHVLPGLASARFVDADVSFRPASIDGMPLIGPSGLEGLWLATGHFRNGILLAPATASLIAAQIAVGERACEVGPFDPRRLGEAA
jgi:glycine oxidase